MHKQTPLVARTDEEEEKKEIRRRRNRYTRMNTQTRQADQHCTAPVPSFGTPPRLPFNPPPNSIIHPPLRPTGPSQPSIVNLLFSRKRSRITALDLSFHLRDLHSRRLHTDTVRTRVCKHQFRLCMRPRKSAFNTGVRQRWL